MVFNPVGERGEGEEIVLVNPRVTKYSKKMVLFDEGCLSFPGIYAGVKVVDNILFYLFRFKFIHVVIQKSLDLSCVQVASDLGFPLILRWCWPLLLKYRLLGFMIKCNCLS